MNEGQRTTKEWSAFSRKLLFHARMQGERNVPVTGFDDDDVFMVRMDDWNPNWKQRVNMMPEEWQKVQEVRFESPRIL